MLLIFEKVKMWLIGLLLAAGAILGFYLKGRSDGSSAKEKEHSLDTLKAKEDVINAKKQAQEEVSNLGSGGSADKLRSDWMRDDSDK